jgi:hypothetical protein
MSRYESRLDKELRFHLEQRTADLIAAGHNPAEARRLARIEIGGPEQAQEQCRDERRTRWLEDLWRDAIYALRSLLNIASCVALRCPQRYSMRFFPGATRLTTVLR